MDPIPKMTLTTDRLTLRPFARADAPALHALVNNRKVARMLLRVPNPYPPGLAERWIAGHARARATGAGYVFAIDLHGALIGTASLERRDGAYTLGYWIGEPWWGRGFASEAVRRLVDFAFDTLGETRIAASCFQENKASARILEKCGFVAKGAGALDCAARGHMVPAAFLELKRAPAAMDARP